MPLKTLQLEISNWKGLNRYDPETDIDPHYLTDCGNVDFDEAGLITKRAGGESIGITFSGTINMIYDWQKQGGFTWAGDRQRTVVIAGGVGYVIQGFNDSNTISYTFGTANAKHYAITDDVGVTYLANENGGVPKMLAAISTSSFVYRDATLAGPALASTVSATTAATGSATLTGTFQHEYSYVDLWGNESPLSPESAEVALAGESLACQVVGSADPTVDYIKNYVLGPQMSEYCFSGTCSNTTQTYNHTISMADLMAAGFPPDNLQQPCPSGKYLALYEDMLLIAGDPNVPDTVWCSDRQYHRQFQDNYARCVSGDGQAVKGFGASFDKTVILKADSLFLCDGVDETTFNARLYSKYVGVLGQPSVTNARDQMAWFSDDGIYRDNGSRPEEVSIIVRNHLRTLDSRNLVVDPPKQVAAAYKYFKQNFWAVRETTATAGENDALMVWNYERDTWTRYTGNVPCCLGQVQVQDDYELLFGGNANGQVWMFMPPSAVGANDDRIGSTQSTLISAYFETPWIHLPRAVGVPDWERSRTIPRYLKIYASGIAASPATEITIASKYYVDFDHDKVIGTFSSTFTCHAWPTVRPYHKTIYYGGAVGTFNWVKWRFDHAQLGEHFKIHKLVFGFKAKPSID